MGRLTEMQNTAFQEMRNTKKNNRRFARYSNWTHWLPNPSNTVKPNPPTRETLPKTLKYTKPRMAFDRLHKTPYPRQYRATPHCTNSRIPVNTRQTVANDTNTRMTFRARIPQIHKTPYGLDFRPVTLQQIQFPKEK